MEHFSIRRLFLSRKTVLTLLLFILGTIIIAYIVPQAFNTPRPELEKWRASHPAWRPWVESLGLDHVYYTPWFAVLLSAFSLCLTLSTYEQIRIAYKRTFSRKGALPSMSVAVDVERERVLAAVKQEGYVQTFHDRACARFIRHPWGYWGNALLHAGMVLVIASALVFVLTHQRGRLRLVQGETYEPEAHRATQGDGTLIGNFVLPERLRLDRTTPEFWETDHLKQLTTHLSFFDSQGKAAQYVLAVNQTITLNGIRFFQGMGFGTAFFVEFSDQDGSRYRELLLLDTPARRDKPSYDNFQLAWMPCQLKVKYFADAEKRSLTSMNPLLVLRLFDGSAVQGETALTIGKEGRLGAYSVKLVRASRWGEVIFMKCYGILGVFIGFFIIVLGSSLIYCTPPREFVVKEENGRYTLGWKATRFAKFYESEYERVVSRLGGK